MNDYYAKDFIQAGHKKNWYYHKSQSRHSDMDRRNPVAMDGTYKAYNQLIYRRRPE